MKLSLHISSNKRSMKSRKGFTLIELLIVIAILGILAAGLLAALDPIDQVRKARDSTRRSIATEFAGALNRYYTQTEQFPWGTAATAATNLTSGNGLSVIGTLTAGAELKSSFQQGIPDGRPIWFFSDANQVVYACFQQESRAPNAADQYTGTSLPLATGATCAGTAGGTSCWFCAR